jgi:hypothetical protein
MLRQPGHTTHAADFYLLFAHEPYYLGHDAREINTTVVAAESLLHLRVRQPDGARIHDLLVQGRRSGEIVPLATLTHELDGGARWPEVGDWEAVTAGLSSWAATVTATPSDWACRESPAPWSAPARTPRYAPSTRRPSVTRYTGPRTAGRSLPRSADSLPGQKRAVRCGRATVC